MGTLIRQSVVKGHSEITSLSNFWDAIIRSEEFIRHYAHCTFPDWESCWSQDLEENYRQSQCALKLVTCPRFVFDLPDGLEPFVAENAHHSLALILNPPEQWLGKSEILDSVEYENLRQLAKDELQYLQQMKTQKWRELAMSVSKKDSGRSGSTRLAHFLAEYHMSRPYAECLIQVKIAELMGCTQGTVSKWIDKLWPEDGMDGYTSLGLSGKLKRGFLPDGRKGEVDGIVMHEYGRDKRLTV